MCVGYRGVFSLRPVGKLGNRPVDRLYMLDVEERAKKMNRACTGTGKVKKPEKDTGQLELPFLTI